MHKKLTLKTADICITLHCIMSTLVPRTITNCKPISHKTRTSSFFESSKIVAMDFNWNFRIPLSRIFPFI